MDHTSRCFTFSKTTIRVMVSKGSFDPFGCLRGAQHLSVEPLAATLRTLHANNKTTEES